MLHRSHCRAAEHEDKRSFVVVDVVHRVKMGRHPVASPHKVLELIQDDHQRFGRPEFVQQAKDGPPRWIVCRVELEVEVPSNGLHEFAAIERARALGRHEIKGLGFASLAKYSSYLLYFISTINS